MRVEPVSAHHRSGLVEFVSAIAERDRQFLDRTLLSQVRVASWTQAVPERRLVAVEDDLSISGIVTVLRGSGWAHHTADVRLVVATARRGRGVGRALADAAVELAKSMGIEKLSVETMAANSGALSTFMAIGFSMEARLPGGVRDGAGQLQDVVILSRWLTDDDVKYE